MIVVFNSCGSAIAAFAAAAGLAAAGIALADRHADPVIEEVEGAIANSARLTRTINAWEGRWPLNTYRDRDAAKLSRSALERLAMAEAMTLTEYGAAIAVRQRNRETHARLAARYEAAITLAALGAGPVGLGSTGNPVFNVPASMLGIPAVSLPLLSIDGLPLGLQIAGFVGEDASADRGGGRDPRSAGRGGFRFPQFSSEASCASGGSPCHCRLPGRGRRSHRPADRAVRFAERLGFGDVWLTEHYFTGESVYNDALLFASAVAMRTERIRIGFAVVQLPFHHPVRLAVQLALLDNLSRGRIDVGVGKGTIYNEYEFVGHGLRSDDSRERMEEAIVPAAP